MAALNKKSGLAFATALLMISVGMIGIVSDQQSLDADVPDGYIPVSNAADLARIGTGVSYGGFTWSLTSSYCLTQDIVLSGTNNHVPVGKNNTPFRGILDGQGFKITHLNISSGESYVGLFAVALGATITDLTLESARVEGTNASYSAVGAIIGYVRNDTLSTVTNCVVSGTVISVGSQSDSAAGGIIGNANKVTITGCVNNASVQGSRAGGIVGTSSATAFTVVECVNNGEIRGRSAGGIAGAYTSSTGGCKIQMSANHGNVIASNTSSSASAGGISATVGNQNSTNVISDCYNTGNISATTTVSGSTLQVSSDSAGILAQFRGTKSSVVNCYSVGFISSTATNSGSGGAVARAGGCASNDPNNLVSNSYYLAGTVLSGTPSGDQGISLSSTALKNESSFANWDFEETWMMRGSYPELRAFVEVIEIDVQDMTVVCGQNLVLTPVVDSSLNLDVSGASWLTATGNVVSGVAPSTPGTFTVTITVEGTSATFTVTVVSKLSPTNSPTNGVIVLPR